MLSDPEFKVVDVLRAHTLHYEVFSNTTMGKSYRVTVKNGATSCTCKGWSFNYDCSHCKKVREHLKRVTND